MRLRVVALTVAGPIVLIGCSDNAPDTGATSTAALSGPRVVASTTWTGAFARAAGASDVRVIAPAEFQHPPDYEPRPSDLLALRDADFVVFGGMERFVDRLKETAGGGAKVIQVRPDNTRDAIRAEVSRLGGLFGTQRPAEEFLGRFEAVYNRLAQELRSAGGVGADRPAVISNVVQAWWAELAGLKVLATFPNQPLSAQQVADLAARDPDLVFDNANVPGAAAVAQEAGAERVLLTNFPDRDLDLIALFEANAGHIRDALRKREHR
ncbi:MAG: metal ABC transporter solute-binding protein, Zn/Mn family [Acidimicrobiales bacterium]